MPLFYGLGQLFQEQQSVTSVGGSKAGLLLIGQVLDVCLDETSQIYKDPSDIGCIRFRDLTITAAVDESSIQLVAYPLDRSIERFPIPGEQVIVFKAISDTLIGGTSTPRAAYFYSFVVTNTHNITYNSLPFLGTTPQKVDQNTPVSQINADELAKRFDQKLHDVNSFKEPDNRVTRRKSLRPYEGDFILQGRFGSSIRLGSNNARIQGTPAPWSKEGSVSGDPIMVLRVDRGLITDETQQLVVEDPDLDDASIYFCSSQNVPISLSCTAKMKSWAKTYGLVDKTKDGLNQEIKNNKAPDQNYQKTIDTTQPVSDSYQVPTSYTSSAS